MALREDKMGQTWLIPPAIDCYFWDPEVETSIDEKRKKFVEFWKGNINRPAIIPEIELV